MSAFTVTPHGREIDTVFYDDDFTAADVKQSLVSHDGYDPMIEVAKVRKAKS